MSDKDTVDEILWEGLKFDSSRHVEEVSREPYILEYKSRNFG